MFLIEEKTLWENGENAGLQYFPLPLVFERLLSQGR